MSFFRLGNLAALLSEPLVNGFTTGAAVHVTVSQLKDLFGVAIPRRKGAFKVVHVSANQIIFFLNIFANGIHTIHSLQIPDSNRLFSTNPELKSNNRHYVGVCHHIHDIHE